MRGHTLVHWCRKTKTNLETVLAWAVEGSVTGEGKMTTFHDEQTTIKQMSMSTNYIRKTYIHPGFNPGVLVRLVEFTTRPLLALAAGGCISME